MLGTQLAQLRDGVPTGLANADDVVAGFDEALLRGFARVAEADTAALTALADAVAGTPLADRVAEAVGKVTAGSVGQEQLAGLAGARVALLGAAHDALLDRLDTALGRDRAAWTSPTGEPADASPARAAARSWLHETALAGWQGVDHELLSAVGTPVETALAEPGSRRLAVLLDGLAAELRAGLPVATMPRVPVRRWADLWSRGVLLAQDGPTGVTAVDPERVTGRLLPLGVDVHEHETAVQVQLHAILEPADAGTPRLVRVTVGAAKVATIGGPAVWRLLSAYPVLLTGIAQRRALTVTDLPAHGGDLLWVDGRAQAAEPADPFATARVLLGAATATATPPLDRHPAAIAEPVLLEGYTVHDDGLTLDLDGHRLAIAVDRLPTAGPLTPALVAASSACLGLLRWDDGRWWVQPLAVRATVKRRPVEAHNGDWADGVTDPKVAKAEAKAGDAVAVLRERAGRLLRR
ncbi:hypothetical protein [Micromonospora sp. WMMD987]|uniref:hypothetical protein n=1 Tax=Micromonospora sp. WMMD987 TaxID=3016089 RepID=UPI00249A890F|nr:hypothetical protein [Micromonospora sp. WMMD987]WFE92944.1 hypothetical protein O7612_16100 [Micromonospora sp. WMMD987]